MSKKDKIPDIDEMIKDCKAKQKPDEVICFAVGAGRILPKLGMRKQTEAIRAWNVREVNADES